MFQTVRWETKDGMLGTTNKFVVAYTFLVVLPVLGLAGLLSYGRGLTAPLSVSGVWHFQTGSNRMADLRCVNADVLNRDGSVVILQSGKVLTLHIGGGSKPGAIGSIEKDTMTASFMAPAGPEKSDGCGKDSVLTLNATVSTDTDPRILVGVLTLPDCASCTPVEFKAVRQVVKQ